MSFFNKQCGTEWFVSPEQLDNKPYSKHIDMWACGLVAYMLLNQGKHPFALSDKISRREFHRSIKNIPVVFQTNCDFMAVDFVERLLRKNYMERYTVYEAVSHPWITKQLGSAIPMKIDESQAHQKTKASLRSAFKAMALVSCLNSKIRK